MYLTFTTTFRVVYQFSKYFNNMITLAFYEQNTWKEKYLSGKTFVCKYWIFKNLGDKC